MLDIIGTCMVHKTSRSASVSTSCSLIYSERPLYPPATIDFYPHHFHQLTTPSSRNSIACTSIQNPRGTPSRPSRPSDFRDIPGYPPSFHAFPDSLARLQNSTPFFSAESKLFLQNTGGGGLRSSNLQ